MMLTLLQKKRNSLVTQNFDPGSGVLKDTWARIEAHGHGA